MEQKSISKSLYTFSFIAIGLSGLSASSTSVVVALLKSHYDLSYNLTGILLAVFSFGNLISGLLSAFLPQFIGRHRTLMLFSAGTALGYLILSKFSLPAILCIGFLFVGFAKGNAMNNVSVNIGDVSVDKTKGLNLVNAAFATGCLSAPIIYLVFSNESFPWFMPILMLSVCGCFMWGLLIMADSRSVYALTKKSSLKGAPESNDTWEFLRERHFWYSVAFLFGQQCAEISVTGWLVTYFKETGILTGYLSEFTVTVIWLAMLSVRLLIGFVLPQTSKLRDLTIMSIACIITYLLLLFSDTGIIAMIALFLFGFSIGGIYPTAIAQAGKNLSNASIGILLPCAGAGAVIMPYITGAVASAFSIKGGMACSLAALFMMLVFSILLKRSEN